MKMATSVCLSLEMNKKAGEVRHECAIVGDRVYQQ